VQITYEQTAWADFTYFGIDSFKDGTRTPMLGNEPGTECYFEQQGYAPIGKASVTLTFFSEDEVLHGQLKSLDAQLQAVRAEAQVKENAILLQISKLQSLTMG
jgi:hypothetical protein